MVWEGQIICADHSSYYGGQDKNSSFLTCRSVLFSLCYAPQYASAVLKTFIGL